ncbi:MAG: tight adherence protein [Acidimicrobiaceae bacterium]|jgi:tight adherence protein B
MAGVVIPGPGPHATAVAALVCGSLVAALATTVRLALVTGRRGSVVQRLPGYDRAGASKATDGLAPGQAPSHSGSGPRWLPAALVAADVGIDAPTVWKLWCGGVVVSVTVVFVMAGPALAVAALVAGVAGPAVALRSRRGRGDARVEAALPGALEAVARALRTGASLRQAVGEAASRTPGPLGHELERVSTQTDRGAPLVAALEALAERRPLPGVRLAVAALCLGAETGGAQARSVDGVAATLRDRLGLLAEVRALSSQARISALVISLAPLGFGAFAAATDPRTSTFLFHTAAGFVLLAAGGLLDALGWVWMNRLSRVTL